MHDTFDEIHPDNQERMEQAIRGSVDHFVSTLNSLGWNLPYNPSVLWTAVYLKKPGHLKVCLQHLKGPSLQPGEDPVHQAATLNSLPVLKLLKEFGFPLDQDLSPIPPEDDEEGNPIPSLEYPGETTPLHDAVKHSSYAAARWLLKQGARPNQQDEDGNSALHLLLAQYVAHPESQYEQRRLVRLFIQRGASLTLRGAGMRTPLEIANQKNRGDIVSLIELYTLRGDPEIKAILKKTSSKTSPKKSRL